MFFTLLGNRKRRGIVHDTGQIRHSYVVILYLQFESNACLWTVGGDSKRNTITEWVFLTKHDSDSWSYSTYLWHRREEEAVGVTDNKSSIQCLAGVSDLPQLPQFISFDSYPLSHSRSLPEGTWMKYHPGRLPVHRLTGKNQSSVWVLKVDMSFPSFTQERVTTFSKNTPHPLKKGHQVTIEWGTGPPKRLFKEHSTERCTF